MSTTTSQAETIDKKDPSNEDQLKYPLYGYLGLFITLFMMIAWGIMLQSDYDGIAVVLSGYTQFIGVLVIVFPLAGYMKLMEQTEDDKQGEKAVMKGFFPIFATAFTYLAMQAGITFHEIHFVPSEASSEEKVEVVSVSVLPAFLGINYRVETTGGTYTLARNIAFKGNTIEIQTRSTKDGWVSMPYACKGENCALIIKKHK